MPRPWGDGALVLIRETGDSLRVHSHGANVPAQSGLTGLCVCLVYWTGLVLVFVNLCAHLLTSYIWLVRTRFRCVSLRGFIYKRHIVCIRPRSEVHGARLDYGFQ